MSQSLPSDAIAVIFAYLPWSDKAWLCLLNRRVANRLIPPIGKERQKLIEWIEKAHEESQQMRLTQLYPTVNRLSGVQDQLEDELAALWERFYVAMDGIDERVISAASATAQDRLVKAVESHCGKVLTHVAQVGHFNELAARITDENILHMPRRPTGPMKHLLIEVSGCVLTAAFEIQKTSLSIDIATSCANMAEHWGRVNADAAEVDDVEVLEARRQNAILLAHISTLYPQVLDCAQRKRDVEERLFECFKEIHTSVRRMVLLMALYNQLQQQHTGPGRRGDQVGRRQISIWRKLIGTVKGLF